jgi:hypothetical protein
VPAGRWRIEAWLHGGINDPDGPPIMLSVTIELVVTD